MIAALILTATLFAVPPQEEPDTPATPAEIAAAWARADTLIREGNAVGVFDNITDDGAPPVLHRASGLTCNFSGDPREYVYVFSQGPQALPRGEDVGCGVWIAGAEHTLYATRYPDRHSAEVDLQAAIVALTQRTPDARPHVGELPLVSLEGQAEVLLAAYDIKVEQQPKLSLILVAKVGEWNFKQRTTGPSEDETLAMMAGMNFILSLPGRRDVAP